MRNQFTKMRQIFGMDAHRKELVDNLFTLYTSHTLTDVTLKAGDVTFACHRNVLAAASPYFRAMFTNPVIERDEKIITLHNIESNILQIVAAFMYTGQLKVTNENVQDLIVAGTMFELPHLIGQCTDHMIQEICILNCVELFVFASHYMCQRLKDEAKRYILDNITEVLQETTSDLLNLDVDNFEEIVSSDELCVNKEESVFDLIVQWASFDAESRRQHFPKLFKHVRLALVDDYFVKSTVTEHQYVKDEHGCQRILRRYEQYKEKHSGNADAEPTTEEALITSYFNTTLRQGMYNRHMLIFSGGAHIVTDRALTAFDPVSMKNYVGQKPHDAFDFRFKIDFYQLVTVFENKIYFIGGIFYDDHHFEDSGNALRDVYQYDMKSAKWEPRACMSLRRCCFSATVIDKHVFVIGGKPQYPRCCPTDSVEMYDSDIDSWYTMSPVPIKLYGHASSATQDAIFVFGGKDEDDDFLDTVFRYDIRTDNWSLVTTQLPKPRAFLSSFTYGQNIFIFGGATLHENILMVSIYNPETNKWSYGADFPEERKVIAAGYHDGAIYVCGGVRQLGINRCRSRKVESRDLYKYDIDNGCWIKVTKLVQYGNCQAMTCAILNTKHLCESDFVSAT